MILKTSSSPLEKEIKKVFCASLLKMNLGMNFFWVLDSDSFQLFENFHSY